MAARCGTERSQHQVIRSDELSDDVLLDIFDFYVDHDTILSYDKKVVESWQTLVHVCQRWRSIVFGSPRRLTLRLFCTPKTRIKDTLGVWPALPIVLHGEMTETLGTDNIIAALAQSNRVCDVNLRDLLDPQWEEVAAAMQVSFPELTSLRLSSLDDTPANIPASFLGGSAPRLRFFSLHCIPFPGLPSLLLSATRLVDLYLVDITPSSYISPEAMVASLSALSSLKKLRLTLPHPPSRRNLDTRRPPPSKRTILLALEHFTYTGSTEYLDAFVSRIDAPQLDFFDIEMHNTSKVDYPRLTQFLNRTPKYDKCDEVHVQLDYSNVAIVFGILRICGDPDLRLSWVAQMCSILIPSTVESLFIEHQPQDLDWQDNSSEDQLQDLDWQDNSSEDQFLDPDWQDDPIETTSWLQLLLPFTTVKNLYLYDEFAPAIADALQELVGDRITEVLPSLQNIFVEKQEPFEKTVGQFVVARRLSGHPVTVSEC